MEDTGIIRNEIADDRHREAWENLIGIEAQKAQALAWAALALQATLTGPPPLSIDLQPSKAHLEPARPRSPAASQRPYRTSRMGQ